MLNFNTAVSPTTIIVVDGSNKTEITASYLCDDYQNDTSNPTAFSMLEDNVVVPVYLGVATRVVANFALEIYFEDGGLLVVDGNVGFPMYDKNITLRDGSWSQIASPLVFFKAESLLVNDIVTTETGSLKITSIVYVAEPTEEFINLSVPAIGNIFVSNGQQLIPIGVNI